MLSYLKLAKVPLCLLIWCSTMFGFALAGNNNWQVMIITGSGVFLLAAGGATLNSLQEYQLDGKMMRTRNRPMVLGHVTHPEAAGQAVLLLVSGLTVIFYVSQSWPVVAAGGVALLLYNAIYTPLKKISVWSILPGALCGAIPPYIGWLCGGGAPLAYLAVLCFALFILWQIPHFWLVILNYKKDYSLSEIPNLLHVFKEKRLTRFFITWISALVAVMLMFLTQFPYSLTWLILIISNSLSLLLIFAYCLFMRDSCNYRLLFVMLNVVFFVHMVAVVSGMRLS